MKGEGAQRGTADAARMLEHSAEIDPARGRHGDELSGGGIAHGNAFPVTASPACANITL
jgi:hypothetical protein